jgi:ABC-2 type transport system permease protein
VLVYWGGAALVLLAAALVLWPRGVNDRFRERLQLARQRLTPVVLAASAWGAAGSKYRRSCSGTTWSTWALPDRLDQGAPARRIRAALPPLREAGAAAHRRRQPAGRHHAGHAHAEGQGRYQLENRSGAPVTELFLYQQPGPTLTPRFSQPGAC